VYNIPDFVKMAPQRSKMNRKAFLKLRPVGIKAIVSIMDHVHIIILRKVVPRNWKDFKKKCFFLQICAVRFKLNDVFYIK